MFSSSASPPDPLAGASAEPAPFPARTADESLPAVESYRSGNALNQIDSWETIVESTRFEVIKTMYPFGFDISKILPGRLHLAMQTAMMTNRMGLIVAAYRLPRMKGSTNEAYAIHFLTSLLEDSPFIKDSKSGGA